MAASTTTTITTTPTACPSTIGEFKGSALPPRELNQQSTAATKGSSIPSTITTIDSTTTTTIATAAAATTMLKRKLEEAGDEGGGGPDNGTVSNGQSESDDSNCSAGSTDALAPEVASGPSPPKRMKKKVNFKGVTVYYFPRRQGFVCVPSEGGSTLGMSEKHTFTKDFSLSDYSKEQKRIHRAILAEQRRQGKMFPSPLLASSIPPPELDDEVSSGSESDSEYDDYYFLQPLPIRQRRVMLRTSGVKKIDNEEKDECRDIRVSRNVCGCDCKVFCDPATCSCSAAGIQCQVDRLSFPCGCTKDGCSNPSGRIEFNPIRVRTHFIHTLMRLELERKDSEYVEVNSAAATTSSLSPTSSANIEIDVVGANGEDETVESGVENMEGASDDSASRTSTDMTSTSEGKKPLKSKLKTKKAEAIDLNMFNSNEKGSCRDCQNTDMCNVMMHDVKFSMVTQQQRQQQQQHQQRVINAALGPQPGYPGSPGPQLPQHHPLSLSPGISLLHPPAPPPSQQQSQQHMLLFNDGEEEVYQAENTTSMYFDNDDGSFSEMSDTSPETVDPRPFASLGQANFSAKFHVSPSQMFTTSISTANSSNHTAMSTPTSLLNPSCIRSLQVSGGHGDNSGTTSCSAIGHEQQQQQSCGLLTHPHPQQPPTAGVPGRSLLRSPFLPGTSALPAPCVGPTSPMSSTPALLPLNGPMTRSQMDTNLGLDLSENGMMMPGAAPSFQNKFPHTTMMDSSSHPSSSPFKLESPNMASQTYGSNGSVTTTDYMNRTNHFSSPTTTGFGNTTTAGSSGGGYDVAHTSQLSSCWSSSLASPTLRECFSLGSTASPAPSSSSDQPPLTTSEISCNTSSYQAEAGLSLASSDPASPSSSTTTYATMTTTTRDRLAAHCPGISSHMDGKPESSTSTLKETPSSYSTYSMTAENSERSSLVGDSQNLLYNLPYTDASAADSCDDMSAPCLSSQSTKKSLDSVSDSLPVETSLPSLSSSSEVTFTPQSSSSSSSQPVSSSESSSAETVDPSPLYSTEISSSSLPLSSFPSLPTSSASSSCQLPPSSSSLTTSAPSEADNDQTTARVLLSGSAVSTTTSTTGSSHVSSMVTPEQAGSQDMNTDTSNIADTTDSTLDTGAVVSEHTFEAHGEQQISESGTTASKAKLQTVSGAAESQDAVDSWESVKEKEQIPDEKKECEDLAPVLSEDGFASGRNYEGCVTDTETASSVTSSAVQSATSSSTTSSTSSSPTTSEEEKEQNMSQNFGEIIKESIVEMVLV